MTQVAHAERSHALLSASSSHRWLHCTPSARLEEQFPDTESEAAKKGTLAHEIAELKLRKYLIEPIGPKKFNSQLKKLQSNPLYEDDMAKATDTYLEYLQKLVHGFTSPPYVAIEKRLDFSSYVPEGFGTGDCLIIADGTLFINDFKYGKGVAVSAEGNPQMRLYALGAYRDCAMLFRIERVQMAIIQPRLDSITEDTISIQELLEWGESIKPLAQQAFEGKGEFAPGEHCRFCRARAVCAARAETYLALESFSQAKPPIISREEVGQILLRAQHLAKWAKDLEAFALSESLQGNEVPGWKAVHGRGSREYADQDAAFRVLMDNGIEEVMLYKREPLTVAKVEELIGKAKYKELLTPHVVSKPGKPTLVPSSDKREAITRTSAEDDFKPEEESPND